jgi:hypothetical protein
MESRRPPAEAPASSEPASEAPSGLSEQERIEAWRASHVQTKEPRTMGEPDAGSAPAPERSQPVDVAVPDKPAFAQVETRNETAPPPAKPE